MELSARYTDEKKRSYVELAYYYSLYSNSLSTVSVYDNGSYTTQFQAVGKARIQGLQLSAETRFSIFAIYANATYSDPYSVLTSKSGADSAVRMGDIAVFSANAGVNAKFIRDKFNVNMRVNYVGDKPTGKNTTTNTNPYTSTPGYTLLNGTLGYSIKNIGVVQFRVDDIFDTQYYAPGVRSASGIQTSRVPQPGRMFYAQFILNLTRQNEHF